MSKRVFTYATVADMIADCKYDGAIATTLGYYTPNDGGGSTYLIKTSSLTADGGSIISLSQSGLQAHLNNQGFVNYKMFGAKCDGTNDDGLQMLKTHNYANAQNIPVVVTSGDYYIKNTRNITIKTNIEWGVSKIHIDESFNTGTPTFVVASTDASYKLDASKFPAIVAKLKKGQTIISELAPYRDSFLVVTDSTTKIGKRDGTGGGWNLQEFFVVEEHGKLVGEIAWDFNNITDISVQPLDKSYLTIRGGTLLINGKNTFSDVNLYTYSGFIVRRSRTIIKDQVVGLEPGLEDTSLNPNSGMYYFANVYDVTLENVRLNPREYTRPGGTNVLHGTYGIGGSIVLYSKFKNVTSEGSTNHWGVFGTNLFKNFVIDSCRLNRVDVHFHCWNLKIKDSDIGYKGFTITGGGDLVIENTTRYGSLFIDFRPDYGSKWDGNIYINNCRQVMIDNNNGWILAFAPNKVDYAYPITLGKQIKVTNFTFDYTSYPSATAPAGLMLIPNFATFPTNDRIKLPNNMEFDNIRVTGRSKGLRLLSIGCPEEFMMETAGLYDESKLLLNTNCTMIFRNIDTERFSNIDPQGLSAHFFLATLATTAYVDTKSCYPKVLIENCGQILLEPKGAIADITVRNCEILGYDIYEGGQGRNRVKFESCDFKADIIDNGSSAYTGTNTLGVFFSNCTFYPPTLGGIRDVSKFNVAHAGLMHLTNVNLTHNHFNSRLSKEVRDYYNPVPEMISALKLKWDSEPSLIPLRSGATASRPTASYGITAGFTYYDTTLKKVIVYTGTGWTDTNGTAV
ncbi:hypothetical protein CEW46_21250 [Bacillus cereus]|nr:hypothetical protein CEW46_21250 [Bacillus cereus]